MNKLSNETAVNYNEDNVRNPSKASDEDEKNASSNDGIRMINEQSTSDSKDLFPQHDHPDDDPDPNKNVDSPAVQLESDQSLSRGNEIEQKSSLYIKTSNSAESAEPVEDFMTLSPSKLTTQDIDTIRSLDKEYDLSLIEREIGWNARSIAVRQNSGLTLWIMSLFLLLGTIVFQFTTDWSVTDSILFCVYTITTVGYGNNPIPRHGGLLIFISFYIFLGIANLTIMLTQLYQWFVLETTRIQYEKDKQEFKKRLENSTKIAQDLETATSGKPLVKMNPDYVTEMSWSKATYEKIVGFIQVLLVYLHDNPYGQLAAVLLPFLLMILFGALVVGLIESWTFAESVYFSVVSMTTVGFGDLVPMRLASKWFCISWLPFSVAFLTLYLSSVTRFYIYLSSKTVERVEQRIRKRLYSHRAVQEKEREEAIARVKSGGFGATEVEDGVINVGTDFLNATPAHIKNPARKNLFAGFATVPTKDQNEPEPNLDIIENKDRNRRRDEVLNNSGYKDDSFSSMKTMKDVIIAVKLNMASDKSYCDKDGTRDDTEQFLPSAYPERKEFASSPNNDMLGLTSTAHYATAGGIEKKPSFALRVLVQERLAAIIAYEIAGYQSHVSIESNTLSVTIDSLKRIHEKWMIPRRALKAFRAVVFEALYYVGERDLILFGPDALFNLKPVELQRLFGPLLAALGDADTMEMWLYSSNSLVDTEFRRRNGLKNELKKDNIEGEPYSSPFSSETHEDSEIKSGINTNTTTHLSVDMTDDVDQDSNFV